MNLSTKIELINENFKEVKKVFSKNWDDFKIMYEQMHSELTSRNFDKAEIILDSIFKRDKYLLGLLNGSKYVTKTIRTRGAKAISERKIENTIFQHTLAISDEILKKIFLEDKDTNKTESKDEETSNEESKIK